MGKRMRLGDLPTEAMGQALCRLTPPMCRMAKDPKVGEALKQIRREDALLLTLGKVGEMLLPCLVGEHLGEMLEVLSILTGEDMETLRTRPGRETVMLFLQCVDEALADFFPCAGGSMKGRSSGESSACPG